MMLRARFGYGTWVDLVRNKGSHNSRFPLHETGWPRWIRNDLIRDYHNSSGFTQQANPCRCRALGSACLQFRARLFASEGCSWRTRGSLALRKHSVRMIQGRGGAEVFRSRARQGRTWPEVVGGRREAWSKGKTVVSAVGTAPFTEQMLRSCPESHFWW